MSGPDKARTFALLAHADQKRRYTGEPYIMHPEAVAQTVRTVACTPEMIAAAYLHDVVEDTPVKLEAIEEFFGPGVASLVWWLSDPPMEGNRAVRKAFLRNRWMRAPRAAKTIKMADLIHNSASIFMHDLKFAPVYAEEAWQLLDAIRDGSQVLLAQARGQIREFRALTNGLS
jgi:(p)ppGpp synthase/HD superfamily hydrolase